MLKIDIITITYNNHNGLLKTGKSILKQTYKHINWIIVDGNSNDNTINYVHDLISKPTNNLNIIFHSEDDRGIYDAMNKGINQAKGDYLLFLNAGDELAYDDVLTEMFSQLVDRPSIIYGNYYRELKNNNFVCIKAKPLQYIYHSLPTSHQAIFYKRVAIDTLRYDLKYKVSSDYFFTSKFIKNLNCIEKKDYLIVNNIIAIFEYNGLSRNNLSELYKDAFDIQKEVFNLNILLRISSYLFKYVRNKFL